MKKDIITRRLRLSALRRCDKEDLIGMLTDAHISETYMVPDLQSEQSRDAMFDRFYEFTAADGRFAYGVYADGRLVGVIHEVDNGDGGVELGYFIKTSENGKGYATEALRAAIGELFSQGYPTVRAAAFEENGASLRVMQKCGMKLTGRTETVSYRGRDRVCVCCEINKDETDTGR
ncbi:MAG: GNAT family N-acetyltransferase [Clostridia bacterium]|nr:GNAT family N-acetyltransferase [Clostridia bacterium]